MKYILLMNTMKAGDYGMATWPKKDQQAHLAYWIASIKSSPRLESS